MTIKKASKKAKRRTRRTYRFLANGSTFHFPNDTKVYIKICNAFSLDTQTGKDCIPSPYDKVIFTGYKEGYYPLWHTGA